MLRSVLDELCGLFKSEGRSHTLKPELKDMKTWIDRLGQSRLRTFTDKEGHFWLEQNPDKRSRWAKLARQGHDVAWEFAGPGGAYTGRMLIDGAIYNPSEATKKFLQPARGSSSAAEKR